MDDHQKAHKAAKEAHLATAEAHHRASKAAYDEDELGTVEANERAITTVEEALNCPELWDLSNGRTLCKPCHRKTDTWGKGVYKYLNA